MNTRSPDPMSPFEKTFVRTVFTHLASLGPSNVQGHMELVGLLATTTAGVISMCALGDKSNQDIMLKMAKEAMDDAATYYRPHVSQIVSDIKQARPAKKGAFRNDRFH